MTTHSAKVRDALQAKGYSDAQIGDMTDAQALAASGVEIPAKHLTVKSVDAIPQELRELDQWVIWKYETRNGKETKEPYIAGVRNRLAKSNDPATWRPFKDALLHWQHQQHGGCAGIGFVFSENDPYAGVDLDHCAPGSQIEPWALAEVETLDSYTEYSVSGQGLHVIVRGKLPEGRRRKDPYEMYDSGRYFTFTGNTLNGYAAIGDRQPELEALHQRVFGAPKEQATTSPSTQRPPALDVDDQDLIERATRAGNGPKFAQLFYGGKIDGYPSESEADQALCQILAFWAGPDPARIDQLFRRSALFDKKWERDDYSGPTIQKGIDKCKGEFWTPSQKNTVDPETEAWVQAMDKQTEPNAAGNGHKANGTATKATHKAIDPIWTIYTLADAYKPRDPIQYVVSGLFALPSLSIVYGPPGCMKTMLLTDMAACIASGSPWLEPLPNLAKRTAKKTLKCPVLWMDFDNGSRVMHERLEAAGRVRNMPEDAPLYYASMPDPWLDMGNPVSAKILEHHARSLGAKAIIVDNLGNVSGKADENSADMGKVMSHFRRLAEETGAAVIVVHHQRKSNGTSGRAGETLRGHSSIEAAIDLALLIERENQADQLKIKSTKTRGVDVSPFGAMFTFTHKLPTTELKTMRFFGFEVEDLSSDKAIRRAILEAVKEQPEVNQGDLVDAAHANLSKVSKKRVRAQILALEEKGSLKVKIGDYNAKLYSIPTDAWESLTLD